MDYMSWLPTILLVWIIGFVAVAVVVIIALRAAAHNKRSRAAYDNLLGECNELRMELKAAQRQIEVLQNNPPPTEKDDIVELESHQSTYLHPNAEVMRLFERLKSLMESENLYCQVGIGRKELSARLCTNENYLYSIVRQATGLTLQDWINEYRLTYAKEMLTTMKEFDVLQVAMASGFGTVRTLQRQFKRKYNMSPIDFYRSTHTS